MQTTPISLLTAGSPQAYLPLNFDNGTSVWCNRSCRNGVFLRSTLMAMVVARRPGRRGSLRRMVANNGNNMWDTCLVLQCYVNCGAYPRRCLQSSGTEEDARNHKHARGKKLTEGSKRVASNARAYGDFFPSTPTSHTKNVTKQKIWHP